MKFVIINQPSGQDYAGVSDRTPIDTAPLKKLLGDGTIEVCYSMVSGGHIYVVTASDAEELVRKVRGNPFFHDSQTEIIPVMDAVDFLEGYKKATAATPAK